MLERATAKSLGRRRSRSPSEVRAGDWVFARSGLTSLKRPSMKWLETAFAEDVGGALLAFRVGRHRAYLFLGLCQNPLHPKLLRPQTRTSRAELARIKCALSGRCFDRIVSLGPIDEK